MVKLICGNRFCKRRKLDPIEALSQCDAPLFKVYLVWKVENSRIIKESSIMMYWKIFSIIYSQKTASWMREDVIYDIRNVGMTALLTVLC